MKGISSVSYGCGHIRYVFAPVAILYYTSELGLDDRTGDANDDVNAA